MSDRIIEIIRGCLVEVTEKPVDRLTTDMRLDEDFDLDSVMFVQFLLALEDRIPNLRFDPEEIGEASFNDVGKLTSFLSQAAA